MKVCPKINKISLILKNRQDFILCTRQSHLYLTTKQIIHRLQVWPFFRRRLTRGNGHNNKSQVYNRQAIVPSSKQAFCTYIVVGVLRRWTRHCHGPGTSGSEQHIQRSTSGSWSLAHRAWCKRRKQRSGTTRPIQDVSEDSTMNRE